MSKSLVKFGVLSSAAFVGFAVLAAGGNLIQNGSFDDSTVIWDSNNFGNIGASGRTVAWTGGQICKSGAGVNPPSGFMVGTYCAYLWGASSVSQDFVLPVNGTCRVTFKAVQRSGQNTPHPIKVSLTRVDTGVTVTDESFTVNSKSKEGDSYQHDFENLTAGPYKLTILGTNINGASCYENVSVTVSETNPFAGIYFVQDCGTHVSFKVRSFGGPSDEAIAVDYAISKEGAAWSEWTSVSSALDKDSSISCAVEQLDLETAYRLKLRLTAGGSEQIVEIPFTTSKELLRNRGFEENTITTKGTKSVSDAAPWHGSASVAQTGYTGLKPKAAVATGGFHAYCWCDQNLWQEVYVPVAGTYHLQFNYVLRDVGSKHVFALELIKDGQTNTIETVENTKTAKTTYGRDFSIDSTGTATIRFRGTQPYATNDGTSFMDDFSLTLVEKASVNPSAQATVGESSITYEKVTINNNLISTGGYPVDIYFAYGPTNGTLGAYTLLRSGVTEVGAFSHTISNLEISTGYRYSYRYENTAGGATTNVGTFVTAKDILRNGSFEKGSSISDSKYGAIGTTASTEAWAKGGMATSDCDIFYPNKSFAVGGYFGYIWQKGTIEQDFEVPTYGVYKLSFRYGLRNMAYTAGTSVKTTISFVRKGVTNEKIWSTDINSTATTFTPDSDDLKFTLKKGTTRFVLTQARNDSNDTSACYDDFKLELVERLNPMGMAIMVR